VLEGSRDLVSERPYRLAVDIGGTFVDAVELDLRTRIVRLAKAPATGRPWEGVFEALDRLRTPLGKVEIFIHGTTLGLNAVLERRGARTGIIANEGLRDIFVIGRSNVPDRAMYDFQYEQPEPIVRRRDTVGVAGRLDYMGRELEPLDEDGLRRAARLLVETQGVEAIAICFLHSYRNPEHERRAAELVRTLYPDVQVSASFEILREYREYERTSTTVLDAYIRPIFASYVDRLEVELADRGFRGRFLIMRSGGGAMTAAQARMSPTHTILSGPAGGIVGAARLATAFERPELLTFDAGGTSLDLCVIERGNPVAVHEAELERYPLLIPVYDIRTLGAGGGSIAAVEDGLLRVGPRSAGAEPGPIAYRRGGVEPTLTDAAIALGYIDTERFLGGAMSIDADAAVTGLQERVGTPLGVGVQEAAVSVFKVLLARTVGAVRQITVERGRDPRTFSLLAFGGAGPLLGPLLARELSIREVIVPVAPAAFSAWGMLSAEIVDDFSLTQLRRLDSFDGGQMDELFLDLEEDVRASLAAQGVAPEDALLERQLDLRYEGQEHSLPLTLGDSFDVGRVRAAFEEEHDLRYGHVMDSPVQVLAVRVRGSARPAEIELARIDPAGGLVADAVLGRRSAWCFAREAESEFVVYDRQLLGGGHSFAGPAIVDEGTSTTILMSDQRVRVDDHGQLLISGEEDS
jgi:N-methylhydantoinase A/oxoprolinase/acetone carboxylase beta subunit